MPLYRKSQASAAPSETTGTLKSLIQAIEAADGSRSEFSVPDNYQAGTLQVWINGLLETDISESGSDSFAVGYVPYSGDSIFTQYVVL